MSDYPWLIAEIGVNWNSLEHAAGMIRASAAAGFRFAKFQLYDDAVLSKIEDAKLRAKMAERKLSIKDLRFLFAAGREAGIEVFATAMYEDAFHHLRQAYSPPFVKIRQADEHNVPLWQALHRDWTGTVFYSTTNADAEYAVGRIPLFCVPKYPAYPEDYKPVLRAASKRKIGISLHAPDLELLAKMMSYEPIAIELHVRSPEDVDCIDAAVSFSLAQVGELIREVRDANAFVVGQHPRESTILRPGKDYRQAAREARLDILQKRRDRRRAVAGKERKQAPGNGEGAVDRGGSGGTVPVPDGGDSAHRGDGGGAG